MEIYMELGSAKKISDLMKKSAVELQKSYA